MERFYPHAVRPHENTVRLIIVYRSYASNSHVSHIGLGVAALNNARVLRQNGFWADVWPIENAEDLEKRIDAEQANAHSNNRMPISHVVISAPWIPVAQLSQMVHTHSEIEWAVCSHSNVGFLAADPCGIKFLRDDGILQDSAVNFSISTNSHRLKTWWRKAYAQHMSYMPNLYDIDGQIPHYSPWHPGAVLRIGSFGAIRPLKNQISAAGAALEISNRLRTDCQFWINGGRTEGGGGTALEAIRQILTGIPSITLNILPWQPWPQFRAQVRSMHLLIQASYTESFNMVTADGCAEGVPSVTSDAIDWVPRNWQASADDVNAIASTGVALIGDPSAASVGLEHLAQHNLEGVVQWKKFLLKGSRQEG